MGGEIDANHLSWGWEQGTRGDRGGRAHVLSHVCVSASAIFPGVGTKSKSSSGRKIRPLAGLGV